jgi:hypothetical protein
MKIFLILFLLFAAPALAQAVDVPVVSFSQQVEIVVTAQQNRNILEVKFVQEKENINLNVIVDKNIDKDKAKKIALNLVMLAKSKSLDDQPKKKDEPGKGIYNYHVAIAVPDGITLVNATKEKAKETLSFEDPFQVEPMTRADEGGQ